MHRPINQSTLVCLSVCLSFCLYTVLELFSRDIFLFKSPKTAGWLSVHLSAPSVAHSAANTALLCFLAQSPSISPRCLARQVLSCFLTSTLARSLAPLH
ncbi:hypothetical protein BKA81DRAFT_182702 [Phyllosticta paracitricarpa]